MVSVIDPQLHVNDDLPKKLGLIDTHAHLQLGPLSQDPAGVVGRALSHGINWIISVGLDLEDAKKMLDIIEPFEHTYACIGFHPHNARNISDDSLAEMRWLAQRPKVVGYGEIGLDFFRNISPREKQTNAFIDQILLAKDLNLPVVIHLRNAYKEGLEILEEHTPFERGGVIHCFSGTMEDALRTLKLGFHISIPGTITYKKNDAFRAIITQVPLDRILLETDCPFLSPEPLRGKDNEPANLIYTARKVAELRQVDLNTIAEITTKNAFGLFGISD